MAYKWPTAGIASQEAIDAEASPETQKAIKEQSATAVAPLTTADVAPKKKGRKAGAKKAASGKKKAK